VLSCGTECCMKSGGGSTPQKSAGVGGSSSLQGAATTPATKSGHRLPCNSQEVRTANCHHGGSCYVVLVIGYRYTGCRY